MADSNEQILAQQVKLLTERVNQITEQGRKISELPNQDTLNPNSLIQVSVDDISQKLQIQKIIDNILNYKFNRLISVAGPITVSGNDITIPPSVWVMENVNYQTISNTVLNTPYAATGYTRNDIIVGNKFNQIVRIAGPETEGVSPTPNAPVDTVLITTVNITDATIGTPTEPVFTDIDWGDIGGNLSDQADLIAALDLKLNKGSYSGTASDLVLGKQISDAPEKTTIADNDKIGISDSENSNNSKYWKFSTVKSVLKTYFDSLYLDILSNQTVSGVKTFLNGKFALRNVADTFSSFFTNANTASRTYTLQNRSGTLLDDTDLSAINTSISGKQVKDDQIEISANSNVQNSWHGQTVLFTANCTITVPSTLNNSLMFPFRTLAGVTVTWAITSPFVWETTPAGTAEKTVGHFMRRGSTNTIFLDT